MIGSDFFFGMRHTTLVATLMPLVAISTRPAFANAQAATVVDTTTCLARASATPIGVGSDSTNVMRSTPNAADTARVPSAGQRVATGQPNQSPVDVVIFAEASAGEVRFNSQPQIHVRLCGGLDSIHVLDRRNLPSPVVVGTTYRDVHVAVQIFGRLNADCLTKEILGARIAGDTARTSNPSPSSPTAGMNCASLELRSQSALPSRPPPDSTRNPRR